MANNLAEKAKTLIFNVKNHWKTPAEGNYIPYKETAAYSFGGIGVYFVVDIVNKMILATGNVLIGNTIGIEPRTLYILYVIGILSSIPLTGLRANIIDNTRGREGKYRPYIIRMGIPCVILAVAFVWMPYGKMSTFWDCVTVLGFNIAFQFFFNFFRESYENLIHVLSPNSQERTNVLGFKSVVYSLAPTIINAIMPIIARKFFGGDMANINLYRYAYPPLLIIGIILTVVVYVNTKEKIIQAKTHVVQVKFMDALRAVAKNKYFWIISLAGWIGFLEGSYATILYWLYQYQGACTSVEYMLITTIYGNGSLWGMLFAPLAIKKFGKKKVLVFTNLCNIIFIACLMPSVSNIWIVLSFLYLNAIVGSFSHVLDPSIQADIRDYQQYTTGERIDGMFAAVGLIGSIISLITQGVVPEIYARGGITIERAREVLSNPAITSRVMSEGKTIYQIVSDRAIANGVSYNDAVNAYDALYDPNIFDHLIIVLIMVSVVGAALNLLPYFFYDLTELRQKSIVRALKIRALFEDFASGALSDESLIEAIDLVNHARETAGCEVAELSKGGIKSAKTKEEKLAAKSAYKEASKLNDEIEISRFIISEMSKFSTKRMQDKLMLAHDIYDMGLNGFYAADISGLEQARALPGFTKEEREVRKEAVELSKDTQRSRKLVKKYYPEGIVPFDMTVFDKLFEAEDASELELENAYKEYFADKKNKQIKKRISEIKNERKLIRAEIKKATDQNSIYHRAAKPWLDAQRLINQAESYEHYDDIAALYDDAKARVEEKKQLEAVNA
ncbi:MAG: hypothetical protein GX051_05765 [Clostridiales bacterium]|nr:hypothetical protein [Clostridiales bacterium]